MCRDAFAVFPGQVFYHITGRLGITFGKSGVFAGFHFQKDLCSLVNLLEYFITDLSNQDNGISVYETFEIGSTINAGGSLCRGSSGR
jgi:hypothetical protein